MICTPWNVLIIKTRDTQNYLLEEKNYNKARGKWRQMLLKGQFMTICYLDMMNLNENKKNITKKLKKSSVADS